MTASNLNIKDLVTAVEQWADEKGLFQADGKAQFTKTVEETGEIASAICRGDKELLKDSIGDVTVTLIILARIYGMTLDDCLEQAYNEIAGRKGKMIDGIFVKEEDL